MNVAEKTDTKLSELKEIRNLTDSAYILRFVRNEMEFQAGQYITLGHKDDVDVREYSIYSTEQDSFLEVLIKEVEEGKLSRKLKNISVGEKLKVDGPFGFFTLNKAALKQRNFLFVASGTGISPFHSMIGSYPNLNYHLLHGVRYGHEAYEKSHYGKDKITVCTSRDTTGDYHGRVTDYLKKHPVDANTHVYLCGNCNMIYDVYDILSGQNFPSDNIHAEVYF